MRQKSDGSCKMQSHTDPRLCGCVKGSGRRLVAEKGPGYMGKVLCRYRTVDWWFDLSSSGNLPRWSTTCTSISTSLIMMSLPLLRVAGIPDGQEAEGEVSCMA